MMYILLIVVGVLVVFRQRFIFKPLTNMLHPLMPKISQTEQVALDAGSVWIEKEFFSGKPDFKRIFNEPYSRLNSEEKAFLDNETEVVCSMCSEWENSQKRDLSLEVFDYLKKNKFFGMIIPKKYNGLGFSPLAHSAVVSKLASRSQVLAITAMVPNSLGPAELIMNFGTDTQKDYWLTRLAHADEIPCFALTEPNAGSDATSISSNGEVFKDKDGEIKIRLNFSKRYITLGSIATVIGLAFKLRDPNHLLGDIEDIGITCALVDASSKGVIQNRRHDPMGVVFINSPLEGKNVVISVDDVIGAKDGLGKGWHMLMLSLSVGRGVSLPSVASGSAKTVAKTVGHYSRVREQFGISIANFEGIAEPLARIGAYAYMLEAVRVFTASAVTAGEKPSVINAVVKYHTTESFRVIINDAMDIMGGAAISRGPKNMMHSYYNSVPIAITVEGANILTRTLMQYGQGLIRAHPTLRDEFEAIRNSDSKRFESAILKHIVLNSRNFLRAGLFYLSRGYLHRTHVKEKEFKVYERRLAWASANFALLSEVLIIKFGSSIKRHEFINARMGDILSYSYLLSAVLRRYEEEPNEEDKVYVHWYAGYALEEIQKAFEQVTNNISCSVGTFILRINPLGLGVKDEYHSKVALHMSKTQKNNLCNDIYWDENSDLQKAFDLRVKAYSLHKSKNKKYTDEELKLLEEEKEAVANAIAVDSFTVPAYKKLR